MDSRLRELRDVNEQLVLRAVEEMIVRERIADARHTGDGAVDRDALTDLPNRHLLLTRFAEAEARAQRNGRRLALLFVDLDGFKQVNDSLGHAHGDIVLQHTAACLVSVARAADTVSRYGGDEFVLLLTDVDDPTDVGTLAVQMLEALATPMRHGASSLHMTASIGISIYPDDGTDVRLLIDQADHAMYAAKRAGPGRVAFHAPRSAAPPDRANAGDTALRFPPASAIAGVATLREANEQLVLAVLSEQALRASAEEARQKQSEFVAMLVHELRNPLAPMRNAAVLLAGPISPAVDVPKLQAIIERQVVHMTKLIDDLLDVSRVWTGKLRLDWQRVDLLQCVALAVEACQPAMIQRGQSFIVTVPPNAVWLAGDPTRLVQVVSNLLDNASKYTPFGGTIALTVRRDRSSVTVLVSDTGIGIATHALPHIFDLFTQDADATHFNDLGLGIGLTVVRDLVNAHGGTITAGAAASGTGSEFVVSLPLVDR